METKFKIVTNGCEYRIQKTVKRFNIFKLRFEDQWEFVKNHTGEDYYNVNLADAKEALKALEIDTLREYVAENMEWKDV